MEVLENFTKRTCKSNGAHVKELEKAWTNMDDGECEKIIIVQGLLDLLSLIKYLSQCSKRYR